MQNIFLLYSIATLKLLHQWLATRLVRRSSQPHPNGHFQIAKSEAAELARRRTFSDSTRWPSFARLTPSFEGHTSPDLGQLYVGLRRSMARHTKPPSLRGGEVWAGLDSNQRRRKASRFTVCPVWPLRYLPVVISRGSPVQFSVCSYTPAEQLGQRISRAVYIGLHLAHCKWFLGALSRGKWEQNTSGPERSPTGFIGEYISTQTPTTPTKRRPSTRRHHGSERHSGNARNYDAQNCV